jgi:hypothetical protein
MIDRASQVSTLVLPACLVVGAFTLSAGPTSLSGHDGTGVVSWAPPGGVEALQDTLPQVDPRARIVQYDPSGFAPDPEYDDEYDYQAQLDIYGGKHLNRTQRPLLELGRRMYDAGPFRPAPTLLGRHNLMVPQLLVYGDLRTSSAFNDGGIPGVDGLGTWATRLNLDVDLKLTGTERIHAFFRPFDKDGEFTRFDFTGDDTGFKDAFDAKPDALFFEGDLGAILGGLSGRDAPFDLPFAAGLMPLVFHNGVWVQDAFTGAAFTLPARNSAALDWSNFDISFFFGFDRVTNPALGGKKRDGRIFGMNTFIEAYQGFMEIGYAYLNDETDLGMDYHSVAFSFTRRYRHRVSNSVRYIGSFGQSSDAGFQTANGHLFLLENSLITRNHYRVVPYFNLFVGLDQPVPAARDAGAGGILVNTGLSFESDGLTGFPTIDPFAQDAVGGALGINWLAADFGQQLVLEVAATQPIRDAADVRGGEYAVGLRYQRPLTNAIIFRADAMYGMRQDLDDVYGARVELRHKF